MIRQINAADYYKGIFPDRGELTFLDFGANLGLVSIYAVPACRRIISIEPETHTFAMLQRITKPYPKIEAQQFALAPFTGTVGLTIDTDDFSCHSSTNHKANMRIEQVQSLAWKDIITRFELRTGIDVCKVDVEGAELASLTEEVFDDHLVKTWYIEVHKTPSGTRDSTRAIMMNRLEKAGYTVEVRRSNALIGKLK